MLVLKIALGIVLAFAIIGIAQCAFAVVLIGGIARAVPTVPVATARGGGGIGLTTPARTSQGPSLSPALAPGYARLAIQVLDAATLQAVAGVCVAPDASACDAAALRTDASGRTSIDVRGGAPTIYLSHPDYVAHQRQITIGAGQSTFWQISMQRSH